MRQRPAGGLLGWRLGSARIEGLRIDDIESMQQPACRALSIWARSLRGGRIR
jgi:hypothetical protein